MNAPIRRLGVLIAALFVGLLVATTSIQVVQAPSLRALSFNRRTLLDNYSRDRGAILIAGKPVARSVKTDDDLGTCGPTRRPRCSPMSPATTPSRMAPAAHRGLLRRPARRDRRRLFYQRISDLLTGTASRGATLEPDDQPQGAAGRQRRSGQPAWRGRRPRPAHRRDPRDGEPPAVRPQPALRPRSLTRSEAAMKRLTADKTTPLVNRAIGGNLYPPGSVFRSSPRPRRCPRGGDRADDDPRAGLDGPARIERAAAELRPPRLRPRQRDHPAPRAGDLLQHRLRLDRPSRWAPRRCTSRRRSSAWSSLRVPMRVTSSVFPADLDRPHTAQSAIGQFDVRVTPLQVAMISGPSPTTASS